jgi:hypothetical protein
VSPVLVLFIMYDLDLWTVGLNKVLKTLRLAPVQLSLLRIYLHALA